MTLDENIARVRELLVQRDQIDRELNDLIGGEPSATAPTKPAKTAKPAKPAKRAARAAKPAPPKGTKVCKKCGKPGHMAKTCTTPTAETPAFGNKLQLTEDQFDELKHLQSVGELISKDFAFDRDLPLSEVNRAITSRNYEVYSNS